MNISDWLKKGLDNLTTICAKYINENNEIEFLIFEEQGSYYTYSATLKDKNSSVNKEIKFVMKLEDGTNFKMSFSF